MRKLMFLSLLLPLVYGDFIQKYYLPKGLTEYYGQICVADIDRDSIPEIFDNDGDGLPYYFFIRKSTGDNQYTTVYSTNPDTIGGDISSTHAGGDFDNDGIMEFAMSGTNCWIY